MCILELGFSFPRVWSRQNKQAFVTVLAGEFPRPRFRLTAPHMMVVGAQLSLAESPSRIT